MRVGCDSVGDSLDLLEFLLEVFSGSWLASVTSMREKGEL